MMNTYPIFIGIKNKNNSIEIVLPRISIKSKDAWKPDIKKLKNCDNELVNDETFILNLNKVNSSNKKIKCIIDSLTFKERNIFLKAYQEIINNSGKIFKNSIKESGDTDEKKLLNESIRWIQSKKKLLMMD